MIIYNFGFGLYWQPILHHHLEVLYNRAGTAVAADLHITLVVIVSTTVYWVISFDFQIFRNGNVSFFVLLF